MAVNLESIKSEYPFAPRTLELDGNSYSYLDEGTGEPILMVHGNPTWSFYYRKLVSGLRDRFRVIVPDHIGCGLSSKPQNYSYTLKNHIKNLSRLIEKTGINGITLVMHDWGGAIGMGYAVENPGMIKRLVIFNSAAFVSRRIPPSISFCKIPILGEIAVRGFNGFVGSAVNLSFGTAKPERFTNEVKRGYLSPYLSWHDRIAVHRFVKDIPMKRSHQSWELLKSIEGKLSKFSHTPATLIWGMKDFCFNEHFLNRWMEILPNAEPHRLKDAGHFVLEDAHEKIIPIIADFIKRK